MAEPSIPPGFDFTDPGLCLQRLPVAELAELRRTAPVWWSQQPRGTGGFDDDGYWVVTRHADVLQVSRASDIYSSEAKSALIRYAQPVTAETLSLQRLILLNLDPPAHTKLRAIVSRGFTPRAINGLREALTARAGRIVRAAVEDGTGDFVTDVACELPLQAIAELLGVPQEDRRKIFDWSNQMIGSEDPEYATDSMTAGAELIGYSLELAGQRRECPRDDIVTRLVTAEVDGDSLSADEFGYFMILLAVAGNETTRNAISHGMLAFLDHPQEWELYRAQRPDTAVDEIVRWATPVTVFQRTALRDTTLGGQDIRAGQRVGLFYRSANFDEEVFGQPERFNILRSPNPHVG
ncbi:MAG: cytochrome P450, partial [Actinobacteria bacterium]|nr:cytochrome P450 [Actinomycetota bacterium]